MRITTVLAFMTSSSYIQHRHPPPGRLSNRIYSEGLPPNEYEDVMKRIEEKQQMDVARYLDPMKSAGVQGISKEELAETFGKPSSPENLEEKELEHEQYHPFEPPRIPPTNKLPYFVNLEFPNTIRRTENTAVHTDVSDTSSIPPKPSPEENSQGSNDTENTGDETFPAVNRIVMSGHEGMDDGGTGGLDMSVKDPLRDFIDANEDYGDLGETYGPPWYKTEPLQPLTQVELEDGWSILPCGKIYKHMLRPSEIYEEDRTVPDSESCCTFAFKVLDAISGRVIFTVENLEGPMMATYMTELEPSFQRCLKSMECGEQAEFVFHISEYNPNNVIVEGLEDVEWVRVWLYLWEVHGPNERWWGLSPYDAHLYPEKQPSQMTREEEIEKETEMLKDQIETELSVNPASPLWNDVMSKMSQSQKESVLQHFERQMEQQEKMKYAEYSGSRGFGDALKQTGQLGGYDVGQRVSGVSKIAAWKETPFMMYVAIQVVPGIRAEHISMNLSRNHLCLRIGDVKVVDDDLSGQVDSDVATNWVMSEAAMNHKPLDRDDPLLNSPTVELFQRDNYDSIASKPAVLIALRKASTSLNIWGSPFVNC